MKLKRFLGLLLAVLLAAALAVTASAPESQLNYVTDEAGLFTEDQREELE